MLTNPSVFLQHFTLFVALKTKQNLMTNARETDIIGAATPGPDRPELLKHQL